MEPLAGPVAETVEAGRQVGGLQEADDFAFRGFDEVFFEPDASVAEHHGFAVDGLVLREPTLIAENLVCAAGGTADGQELGDAEGGVDMLAQAAEIGIPAEEFGEFAPCRVAMGT